MLLMKSNRNIHHAVFAMMLVLLLISAYACSSSKADEPHNTFKKKTRVHTDHSNYFNKPIAKAQDVTARCLECHEQAATDFMKTAHWNWLGDEVTIPESTKHKEPMRMGKKNLINNFCIGIDGNWPSCTKCHAGYGWSDETFDFKKQENVDCLVCHERTGEYRKSKSGLPKKGTDLLAAAKSVGFPKRENCGVCHFFGGGGLGVKHGDLDNSLEKASPDTDVHMGRENMLCIDCHKTVNHNITGTAYSVSVDHRNGIGCTDCHTKAPHKDERINSHLGAVACQTCHIPSFANEVPTKMDWDWSLAGDDNRPDNPHEYLKIKGEFIYNQSVHPTYAWFNLKADRYIVGDKIDPQKTTVMNQPLGSIKDKTAKIWPFKVHTGKQPYDSVHNVLIPPVTAGEGGFWWEFDWSKALEMGAKRAGIPFSGKFDFAATTMYWPLSHMVAPKEKALGCTDCHSKTGRMDWKALGYGQDPMMTGGRR